jgi:hypothetical protein
MADGVFNISKGRGWELADRVEQGDPAASRLVVKLLTTTGIEADGVLEDYDTFSAMVAGSNTEADFTNYASGKVITNTDITLTTDDTGNTNYFTIADQTWTAAGGATNNTLAKLIVCYDPLGTNVATNLVPISHHDFSATTNGNDLTADFGTKVFEAS